MSGRRLGQLWGTRVKAKTLLNRVCMTSVSTVRRSNYPTTLATTLSYRRVPQTATTTNESATPTNTTPQLWNQTPPILSSLSGKSHNIPPPTSSNILTIPAIEYSAYIIRQRTSTGISTSTCSHPAIAKPAREKQTRRTITNDLRDESFYSYRSRHGRIRFSFTPTVARLDRPLQDTSRTRRLWFILSDHPHALAYVRNGGRSR